MPTYSYTMKFAQREMKPDGSSTEWHPLDLRNPSEGLEVGQRFQRSINGEPSEVMIYSKVPGRYPLDESAELAVLSAD